MATPYRSECSSPEQLSPKEGTTHARNVRQIRRKGKQLGLVPTPVATAPSLDSRVALIQALIPVALGRYHAALQGGVVGLAGERYAREGRQPGHVRWTPQARVHLSRRSEDPDCGAAGARPAAESGSAPADLHAAPTASGGGRGPAPQGPGRPLDAEYERCAEAVPEAFGLSASTVSRRFIPRQARKLRELQDRRLEGL